MTATSDTSQPGTTTEQILLLEGLERVGRVSTRKVLHQFRTPVEAAALPREQALNRLKGVSGAADLLDRLGKEAEMEAALTAVRRRVEQLEKRGIRLIAFDDDDWPTGLNGLPNTHRPNILYAFGKFAQLRHPSIAIVGRPELDERAFEGAQVLLKTLAERQIATVTGITTGFDLVALKLMMAVKANPTVVASSGLGRIESKMRAIASRTVKAGGLMVSSMAMDHGPFEHDAKECALVQSALATAVVFVDPIPESHAWTALEWAAEAHMPVFAFSDAAMPDRVHVIRDTVDMEWVVAALQLIPPSSGSSR